MTESFKLRGANVRRVSWRSHRSELESLRTIVFIEEQAVPTADEWDGMDDVSDPLPRRKKRWDARWLRTPYA